MGVESVGISFFLCLISVYMNAFSCVELINPEPLLFSSFYYLEIFSSLKPFS